MPPVKNSPDLVDQLPSLKFDIVIPNKSSDPSSVHRSSNHALSVLQNLNTLRNNSKFCDVEIVAGRNVVKAHRSVLSASSPYFQAMFSTGLIEEQKEKIEIHCIGEDILTTVIDFIYTGEVVLSEHNVQDTIIAADMLQLHELVVICTDFLKKELHISNAIGIYRFALDHNLVTLSKFTEAFIESHFPSVSLGEEFSQLPLEPLCKLLDSELLKVDTEYQVFEGVLSWINHDITARRQYIFMLLAHVRLPLISVSLLDRSITQCSDYSLKLAIRSVRKDLMTRKRDFVPLVVYPRLCAKKNIFVIGGSKRELQETWTKSLECIYDTIEIFDTFRGEWCQGIANMAIGRILPGVAALNGKIYVVGGEHECQILANGEVYDPSTNTWSKIASMVVPRCEFGLCAVEGELYALGGWVGEDIGGSIETYDALLDEWHIRGELPEPRFSMGVVFYQGLIYIVGGCIHKKRHQQDLISYNPVTGEWQTLSPMLEPRSQIGVTVLDNYLYVVGGINRYNNVLKSVERYSFEENKWSYVAMLKVGRASPAVAAANGYLYVMGGDQTLEVNFYKAQVTISSVERYDPHKDIWEISDPLRESRSEAAAAVL